MTDKLLEEWETALELRMVNNTVDKVFAKKLTEVGEGLFLPSKRELRGIQKVLAQCAEEV